MRTTLQTATLMNDSLNARSIQMTENNDEASTADVSDRARFVGNQEIVENAIPDKHQLVERLTDVTLPFET